MYDNVYVNTFIVLLQNDYTEHRVIPQYIGTKSRSNRLRALQTYHGNGTIADDVIAIKFNRFVQRETKTDWRIERYDQVPGARSH